jgi:hypothetical protein
MRRFSGNFLLREVVSHIGVFMQNETSGMIEERIASLFQPDVLLPVQYETLRRKSYPEPEKRLMLAVLEDAIACFQNYLFIRNGKRKTIFQDSEEWIFETNGDWIFSFQNVCEVLGFNPEFVRQGLLCWKEKKVAEHHEAKLYRLPQRPERNGAGLERRRGAGEGLQKVVRR